MPHPLLHLGLHSQGSFYILANGSAPLALQQEGLPRAKDGQAPPPAPGKATQAGPAKSGEAASKSTESTQTSGTQTSGKPTKKQPQNPCGSEMFLVMGGMFLIVYFLMLRPQQKQEKARKAMLADLGKGDKIITSAGIHCEIVAVHPEEGAVTVKFGNDTGQRFKMDRAAIARVQGDDPVPEKKG